MKSLLVALLALITNLQKSKGGVSFISINYTNEEGEQQQTLVNVGVSYENAKEKDLQYLLDLDVTTLDTKIDTKLLKEARTALVKALIKPNEAKSKGQINAYEHLGNGLKIKNDTRELYVYGMKVKKKVIVEGNYKADTRRPLTIAKDELRKGMKSSKYRQYKISNMNKVSLKGDTIVFE